MAAHHCLRSEFTEALMFKLLQGNSVNLISPHGQGRRRTLEDLCALLPEGLLTLQGNLRNYPKKAAALIDDLCSQSGCRDVPDLASLLDQLEINRPRTLLILHNFDEMQQGEATGYNDHFFSQLNSINSSANISLLSVSERAVSEKTGNPSVQCEFLQLPALTSAQLLDELSHRSPLMSRNELAHLATKLSAEAAPYSALENMVPKQRQKQ